jgi:hypothetical protein
MDSRVRKVLHNEILRVCEHKPRTGRVSLMAQVGNNQSFNRSCWIFFLIIIQACCLHLPQNPQQSEERWSFCKNKKNHHNNVAKFLHMGGQFHQITSKLKKLLYDSGSAPLLVPIS